MLEQFLFYVLLLVINIIFLFKRVPIAGIPIGIFTFYIGATQFLGYDEIPYNPYSTVFLILIVTCSIVANSLGLREK